jgi:hypothetical protein
MEKEEERRRLGQKQEAEKFSVYVWPTESTAGSTTYLRMANINSLRFDLAFLNKLKV